jgi:hypothetical protein
VLQIHRWLDYLQNPKFSKDLPLGEWVIAEHVVATRGEYVGRDERVEVPYWRVLQDRFMLANDGASAKPPKTTGAWVHFTPPGTNEPYPILVDFGGGDQSYKRYSPKPEDAPAKLMMEAQGPAPVEVLLMDQSGRLLAHDGAVDAADPIRAKRVSNMRDWVDKIRNSKGGRDAPLIQPTDKDKERDKGQ